MEENPKQIFASTTRNPGNMLQFPNDQNDGIKSCNSIAHSVIYVVEYKYANNFTAVFMAQLRLY